MVIDSKKSNENQDINYFFVMNIDRLRWINC